MSDPFIAFVVTAIGVMAALVVTMILWLAARVAWQRRVARLRARFWEHLGRRLVGVVGDPAGEAAWLDAARGHRPFVLQHCLNVHLIRSAGEYKEGLARIYRALGLLERDLAGLGSWRWAVRMRALRRLAAVATPAERGPIAALADEGGETRLLVAQIMGRIGGAEDVLPLLSSWSLASRLSEYPLHVMLGGLAPEALRALLPYWPTLGDATIQRIVLAAAARSTPGACRDILPGAARHPSLEVRIAAAHACGAIPDAETFTLLAPLARDDAWEVRAQAVKALASHRTAAAIQLLADALGDPFFWVRQNAASALGHHGEAGIRRLRKVAASHPDRFARDAAEHVLCDLATGPVGA